MPVALRVYDPVDARDHSLLPFLQEQRPGRKRALSVEAVRFYPIYRGVGFLYVKVKGLLLYSSYNVLVCKPHPAADGVRTIFNSLIVGVNVVCFVHVLPILTNAREFRQGSSPAPVSRGSPAKIRLGGFKAVSLSQ